MSDLDPDLPGLEAVNVQEKLDDQGLYMYSASQKNVLWAKPSIATTADVTGPWRCIAADISPEHRGAESWARGPVTGVFNTKGVKTDLEQPKSCNFLSWWDGDLLRELMDGTKITKYQGDTLLNASGCSSNNGSKANPCLSGDILGDWREEVIFRTFDNSALRIYTTTIPTSHKLRTLLHDPQYRMAIAWQNVGYNQPPHLGFYLGDGMADPPKPNITIVGGETVTQVDDHAVFEQIALYPNPSSTGFNLWLPHMAKAKVMNAQGIVLEEFESSGQLHFGENYATGIYLVEVNIHHQTKVFKASKN